MFPRQYYLQRAQITEIIMVCYPSRKGSDVAVFCDNLYTVVSSRLTSHYPYIENIYHGTSRNYEVFDFQTLRIYAYIADNLQHMRPF